MSGPPLSAPGPDEVHVWWIDVARMPDDAHRVLSLDERARAGRFHRSHDGARWAGARAALRQILAGYTDSSPEALRFLPEWSQVARDDEPLSHRNGRGVGVKGSRGDGVRMKPALANNSSLRFNLTHAGERAALAVAWEREVGIDLEPIDPNLDLHPLLTVVCTPAEASRIEQLPPPERVKAFLTLWTIKEAYLKATGVGLFREARAIEAGLLSDGRATVRDLQLKTGSANWSLRHLDAGPGWVAALAAAGGEADVRMFAWPTPR